MSRLVFTLLSALLLVAGLAREARASEVAVDLYTIGQGSYLYASYGHSVLCVRDVEDSPAARTGRCYDYGIADRQDALSILWESVRARAIFTPVEVTEEVMIRSFAEQGRAIERQRLPLSAEEARALSDRLAREVATRYAYAYHPYYANCATQLRDRIDEATAGRLRPGRAVVEKAPFRERMEEGLSGRLFELTGLALLMGTPNERVPSPWEAMYLPGALRDGVAERFGAPAERIEERQAVILPTSPAIGRIAVFSFALLLFAVVRLGARRGRLRLAIGAAFGVLGLLGVALEVVAAVVVWPEFSRNWALALLWPTDLAMPWLDRRWLSRYAQARVAVAVLVAAGEIVGVVGQPVLHLAALVALPMLGLLTALRDERRVPAPSLAAAAPRG